jgi:tetratricopeptide (TPR) repeat protein
MWLAIDFFVLRGPGGSRHEPKWLQLKHQGNALYEKSDYKGAERLDREALAEADKLGPRDARASACLYNLSVDLEKEGRYPEADDTASKALALARRFQSPEPGALYLAVSHMAWLDFRAGRYAKALPLLNEAVSLEGTYPRLTPDMRFQPEWMLADASRRMNRPSEAQAAFQKALALAPTKADRENVRKDMRAKL